MNSTPEQNQNKDGVNAQSSSSQAERLVSPLAEAILHLSKFHKGFVIACYPDGDPVFMKIKGGGFSGLTMIESLDSDWIDTIAYILHWQFEIKAMGEGWGYYAWQEKANAKLHNNEPTFIYENKLEAAKACLIAIIYKMFPQAG